MSAILDDIPYVFRKKICKRCGQEKLYSEFRLLKGPRPSVNCLDCGKIITAANYARRNGKMNSTNILGYHMKKSKMVII